MSSMAISVCLGGGREGVQTPARVHTLTHTPRPGDKTHLPPPTCQMNPPGAGRGVCGGRRGWCWWGGRDLLTLVLV